MLMYFRLKNCLGHRERQPSEIDVLVTRVLEGGCVLCYHHMHTSTFEHAIFFCNVQRRTLHFFSMDSDSVFDVVLSIHTEAALADVKRLHSVEHEQIAVAVGAAGTC